MWKSGLGLGSILFIVVGSLLYPGAAVSETKGDIKAGKATYDSKCAVCHGANGAGDGPAGKAMKPNPAASFTDAKFMSSRTDAQFKDAIKKGMNAMPPYAGMSEKELTDVVAYLRTFAK